ncbi:MAG: CocE/NonD family hydrolase [Candidatus Lokiarchaeota archaeon]|nr:CocE/NonD family hydrolase [Candidatus Lokiarchaeota archaeon]
MPPLQIFIINKNKWRGFNQWPPKTEKLKLYLHSEGKRKSLIFENTQSEKMLKNEAYTTYQFDPSDPVCTYGGRNLFLLSGPHNQIKIEKRDDVLVYTSETLNKGIEVIGEIEVVLYVSSSVKDTDFMVKLVDIFPKGKKSINIIDSGLRVRYREGNLNSPKFIEPDEIIECKIKLGSIAIYFPENHKIGVEISSSNFPRFDVNSNLAGEISGRKFKTAVQKIYHDPKHQSHIILPVYKKN